MLLVPLSFVAILVLQFGWTGVLKMAHFPLVLVDVDLHGGSEQLNSCDNITYIISRCTMGMGHELIVCSACGDRFNYCTCEKWDWVCD